MFATVVIDELPAERHHASRLGTDSCDHSFDLNQAVAGALIAAAGRPEPSTARELLESIQDQPDPNPNNALAGSASAVLV
jgi:hypothetical protein